MKGKKCFGLLLVLSIIFGVSFVGSSGVSALKYPIDTIDFSNSTYEFRKVQLSDGEFPIVFNRSHDFVVGFGNSISVPSKFQFPRTWRFVGNYDSSSNICELYNYSDGVQFSNYGSGYRSYRLSLDYTSYNYHNLIPDDSPFDMSKPLSYGNNSWLTTYRSGQPFCQMPDYSYYFTDTPPLAYENFPRWDFASLVNIPVVNNRFKYQDSQPYTYQYNKLYLRGNQKVDGVLTEYNGLSPLQLFGVSLPDVSNYTLHFSLFDTAVNRLDYDGSPETNVENFTLGGSILFDSDYTFDSNCTYNPTCISLNVHNFNLDSRLRSSDILSTDSDHTLPDGSSLYFLNSTFYNSIECSVSQYHKSNGDSDDRVDFQCRYDPSSLNNSYLSNLIDFRNLNVGLMFGSTIGYDSGSLIHTDGAYKFQDFYVVTNDNWTSTDWTATDNGSGGNIFDSPGYGVPSDGGGEANWFESLTSMFSFGFFNPFAPIFQMFSDNNSCASIPTIAGMIHSEETEVCPWFASTTRNVVTPVLGLSSMMLVFGFAVRWLGSSSGNLFEDSRHEEVSNQGGRWGHYRKGGS